VRDDRTVEAIMIHPVITLARHSALINAAEVMRKERIESYQSLRVAVSSALLLAATSLRHLSLTVPAGTNRETARDDFLRGPLPSITAIRAERVGAAHLSNQVTNLALH
jgi:hypothetical protein